VLVSALTTIILNFRIGSEARARCGSKLSLHTGSLPTFRPQRLQYGCDPTYAKRPANGNIVPISFSNWSTWAAVLLRFCVCLRVSSFSTCSGALYGVCWVPGGYVESAVDPK
jgi:hypothetical protein